MSAESAGGRKILMVAYHDSPTCLPPMFNEGKGLAAAGYDVECLCFASASADRETETHVPRFRTRRFRLSVSRLFRPMRDSRRVGERLASVHRALTYLEFVAKVFWHAVRSGADLYAAHDLPPLLPTVLAAKIRRKPVVYSAHELWSEARARLPMARFWRLMDRMLVPLCDEVVTPEPNRSRIYFAELGARRPPLTVRNCPPYRPPLESSRLRDELARRGIAFRTIVLYQGLIDPMRCIEEIVEASRRFDDGVGLVIIGSGFGDWSDPASKLARHDRVVLFPRVPYEELASYTASADIGILFYRNDCRNNFYCAPNKVFEYMMMGVPVLAARYPGMSALVEGEGVGLCVDPHDPGQIATAVNRLANDRRARRAMRRNALRLSVERYNWEVESRDLFDRYRELLAGTSRAAGAAARAPASAPSRRSGRAQEA